MGSFFCLFVFSFFFSFSLERITIYDAFSSVLLVRAWLSAVIASSFWQYCWPCTHFDCCFRARICTFGRTTLWQLHTSMAKAMYTQVECGNSPATSFSGVRPCVRSGRMRSRSWWCALLAHSDFFGPDSPCDSLSLVNLPEEGPSFSRTGHNLSPASRSFEPPRVTPGWDTEDLSSLSQAVIATITHVRAPSTRQTYALKWSLFTEWCSSCQEDAQSVLCFPFRLRCWSRGCPPPP